MNDEVKGEYGEPRTVQAVGYGGRARSLSAHDGTHLGEMDRTIESYKDDE